MFAEMLTANALYFIHMFVDYTYKFLKLETRRLK